MSPARGYDRAYRAGFPRVSGDEPQPLGETTADGEFSPRERG